MVIQKKPSPTNCTRRKYPRHIISGGQTGTDRAVLDVALQLGISCGGWCPRDRRAEDGRIPERYPLQETTSTDYETRTYRNVADSDGTLILAILPLEGGTALTWEIAQKLGKAMIVVNPRDFTRVDHIDSWLEKNEIWTLNIAGPRANRTPVYALAQDFLYRLFCSDPQSVEFQNGHTGSYPT